MHKLLPILLLLFTTLNLQAYPISPRPLRLLVQESKYIISGYVLDVQQVKDKKGKNSHSIARIEVREQFQGNIKSKVIEVRFNPWIICPAPPRYEKHTHVVAFLDNDKDRYRTVAQFYGAKTMEPNDIAIYKQRIQEIQAINKLTNEQERIEAITEWLVKCAENPVTSGEGIYELYPEGHLQYYQPTDNTDFNSLLATGQKERLKQALQLNIQEKYFNFGLADILYKGNETEVEAAMISRLKTRPDDHHVVIRQLMDRLKHRDLTSQTKMLIAVYDKIKYDDREKAEVKKLIKEFVELVSR